MSFPEPQKVSTYVTWASVATAKPAPSTETWEDLEPRLDQELWDMAERLSASSGIRSRDLKYFLNHVARLWWYRGSCSFSNKVMAELCGFGNNSWARGRAAAIVKALIDNGLLDLIRKGSTHHWSVYQPRWENWGPILSSRWSGQTSQDALKLGS